MPDHVLICGVNWLGDSIMTMPAIELVSGAEDPTIGRPARDRPAETSAAATAPRELPFAEGRRYLLAETLCSGP